MASVPSSSSYEKQTLPSVISFIQSPSPSPSKHLFNAGLGARSKQAKTIAIQRRIDNLDQRYYDGLIDIMQYSDGLSFTVAKRKK